MSSNRIDRRQFLNIGVAVAAGANASRGLAAAGTIPIVVHRDAACGCCGAWVDHLRASGIFAPAVRIQRDMGAIKSFLGVPSVLASCHTAQVAGYVIEGHVPAKDILKLIRTRPAGIAGLAVPGMPAGSPGMEVPGRFDPYTVLAFKRGGDTSVFTQYFS
ncbi:MAG: hypothetical protein B7Y35_13980 [Sphingomonadales bacterium 28-64-96]|nr:MAG: hypothetical protein B7Y35_13980 [Sphingomonadales bacterium 28-64-96]